MLKIRRGGERRDKLGVARDRLTDETCQSKKKTQMDGARRLTFPGVPTRDWTGIYISTSRKSTKGFWILKLLK